MGPVKICLETRAATAPGFPKLLWGTIVRMGGSERPEYLVFQEQVTATRSEYWAKVSIFSVQGPDSPSFMYTGTVSRSPDQAIQLAAYVALTRLGHELEDMQVLRATRFFPRHDFQMQLREYADMDQEDDTAVVQLARFVEAQDTLVCNLSTELEDIRAELHQTREALQRSVAQKRSFAAMEAPPPYSRDVYVEGEQPLAPPPVTRRMCGNARAYLRRFTSAAGASSSASPVPCTCPPVEHTVVLDEESEEDPEEQEPHASDNAAEE